MRNLNRMKKIIAFGASNSSKSINKQFATWAAKQSGFGVKILDLNDYEMPIFSIDREQETGIPDEAHDFKQEIKNSDGIIISLAEHNGNVSAAFKNIEDWVSRIEKSTWANKPVLLLATSPGPRGARSVLQTFSGIIPHRGAQLTGSFSLPSFKQNFDPVKGIIDLELADSFMEQLEQFRADVQARAESISV